jgi:very-short-patch-repair endonuclease
VLTPTEGLEQFLDTMIGRRAGRSTRIGYDDEGTIWEVDPVDRKDFRAISIKDVLESYGLYAWPDQRLFHFLEAVVHPERGHRDQTGLVGAVNRALILDGYNLIEVDRISGHPVFGVRPVGRGVEGRPKNLIFASNGPKPEIGFRDAVNNDIEILSNSSSCLVYEEPILPSGLLWEDLVGWWSRDSFEAPESARKSLGKRLLDSLQSPPEQIFFRTYFEIFRERLAEKLPALIPQVYLHYDPRTLRQLYGQVRFSTQRMDFLLLLPAAARVVIEIDGKQHYSDQNGRGSPKIYAMMARSDRQLRLAGYEVYRFGGSELEEQSARQAIDDFFTALFRRHSIASER